MGLLNPGGPIAQSQRNRCSIWPVEVISLSGVRMNMVPIEIQYGNLSIFMLPRINNNEVPAVDVGTSIHFRTYTAILYFFLPLCYIIATRKEELHAPY